MALAQAAFSFGRDRELLGLFREVLDGLHIHDLRSDLDANRTWLTVSGPPDRVRDGFLAAAALAFDRIDLQRHTGEFPRTGALDTLRLVDVDTDFADRLASEIAARFELPIFRSDLSPEWRSLREGGFGGTLDRILHPDYGPCFAHPQLGITGISRDGFTISVSVELAEEFAHFALAREREIRQRNEEGETMFSGVSAFAYPTPSFGSSRLHIEFSDPDAAPPDPILEWLERRAKVAGIPMKGFEAVGAIRQPDLVVTRSVPIRPEQVYEPE